MKDGIERDAYDNPATIYLLALDDGRVVGGQRLYPTLLPHMMSEVFPPWRAADCRDLPLLTNGPAILSSGNDGRGPIAACLRRCSNFA